MTDEWKSYLDSLTPPQREAVEHVQGPLLILAGPGSGKTRVVTCRVVHLLRQSIPASRILALTFTNKAAEEMRHRVERLAPGQNVLIATFHSFCARLLRRHGGLVGIGENFTIYDTDDSRKTLKLVLEELGLDSLRISPEALSSQISNLKNRLITPERFEPRSGDPVQRVLADVYPAYQRRLLESSAVDFDDLLLHVLSLLRENSELRAALDARYEYVMVDEYQDTNLAQYGIVRALSVAYPNLAVTGDPDQSIYGWRGASLRNILEFERDFPGVKVVRLEQNYRSTKRILQVADALISHNRHRKHKELFTDKQAGGRVRMKLYANEDNEAEDIARRIANAIASGRKAGEFAIFYRVNALSLPLEMALRKRGITFTIVKGLEFFRRKEIKDVMAYLQLINNPRDDVALLRTINTPPRGIGAKTVARVQDHAARRRLPLLEAAGESGLIESLPKRAAVHVARFVTMQHELRERAQGSVEEILGHVVEASGYRDYLRASGSEEDAERLDNVEQLFNFARQFDEDHKEAPLEEFLQQVALYSDVDELDREQDSVKLMTLHAAKGLEFPVVFIVAVEEGLLPHERSLDTQQQFEEERRLLFVGITRAQEELQLSTARVRMLRGGKRVSPPSSFLNELPREEMEVEIEGQQHAPPAPQYRVRAAPPPRTASAGEVRAPTALTTAAEMAGGGAAALNGSDPDDFRQGMAVVHPVYKLGKIVALSGSGEQRRATVNFVTAGEKKFMIKYSELRPAGKPR